MIVRYRPTPNVDNAVGATNVTPTTAVLNGTLISTGTTDTAVFVYWGTSDGGTNADLWTNTNRWDAHREPGFFAWPVTGLSPDTSHYYRFAATNGAGVDWAPESAVFITGDVWIEKTSDASEIGPIPGAFTVYRAATATAGALQVNYRVDGTASNGVDYATLTGSVTIPAGAETAPIVVLPYLNHLVEPMETVELTILPGPYVVGMASNASLNITDYGIVTRTWSGGGTNELAGNPDNWAEGTAPETGTAIMLDGTTNKNMTWNLNTPVLSWTQTEAYSGTVTFAMTYPAYDTAFTNFTILGDCVISNGVWTQIPNPNSVNAERYRLCITVGGDLFLGSNGAVDVTSKGYNGARMGPGAPPAGANCAASHGGRGRDISEGNATYEKCYGSIMEPTSLGSSGRDNVVAAIGGGAIRLTVGKTLYQDGLIRADANEGLDAVNSYSGAGGSVWVTAGDLVGSGDIQANGNKYPGSSGYRGGGGGRVAVVLTNLTADFSAHSGSIHAYGGPDYGAAGTVYLQRGNEPEGCGEIIVDNGGRSRTSVNHATEFLHPPRMPAVTAATVRIRNNALLAIATNYSLNISGVWSNAAGFSARSGSRLVFTDCYAPTTRLHGTSTFWEFVCTNGGLTLIFETNTTTTVQADGVWNLMGSTATNLYLRSSSPGTAWKLNVNGAARQSVRYVDVQDSDASAGAEVTAFYSKDSERNENWSFSDYPPGIVNVWTGAESALWSVGGNWHSGRAPVDEDSVRIPATATDPVIDGQSRIVAGLEIEAGAKLTLNGFSLTATEDAAIAGELAGSGSETVTFEKDLTMSGTLTAAGAETFVLKGNADFSGGSVAAGQSTVALAGGAPQSWDPDNLSFHKIEVATTSMVTFASGFAAYELFADADTVTPRRLIFPPAETVAVETLTLLGAFGTTNIVLRSAQEGQAWKLNVSVWDTVRGVDVQDSDASIGREIGAALCHDGGGNTNWNFAPSWALWIGQTGNGRFEDPANWWPAAMPDENAQVRVDASAPMTIGSAATIDSLTVGGGRPASSVTVTNALTVRGNVVVGRNGTLSWNRPGSVGNDLIVLSGGLLTHAANAAVEINKLELAVEGDCTVYENGAIDVSGNGYRGARVGPGAPPTGYGAGSYGGRGADISVTISTGPCYGSIVAPTNLGSASQTANGYGGGAVRLTVGGTIANGGLIAADSPDNPDNGYIGSGGSIWLTAGALIGSGGIRANGGYGRAGGGGGRVSLVVTNIGATFSGYTGPVEAYGGTAYGTLGAAGTIYRETASDRGRGTVTVDNRNTTTGARVTDVPPALLYSAGEADRLVFRLTNAATLRLTDDFAVGNIWLDTANARLDLGGNTLMVHAREHDLAPGSVLNYGEIIWKGLPPGALIIVK